MVLDKKIYRNVISIQIFCLFVNLNYFLLLCIYKKGKMKKIVILFLLINYLVATYGVAMHQHYCGNRLTSTYIIGLFTAKCGCSSQKKMPKGCCKEKITFSKLSDNQQHSGHLCVKDKISTNSLIIYPIYKVADYPFIYKEPLFYTHAPPPKLAVSLSILHSQFRI